MQPQVPQDRLFTVNKDLFTRLDVNNQAALILHEVIYHELLQEFVLDKDGKKEPVHKTSFYARYFNESILADTFAQLTPEQYIAEFGRKLANSDQYMLFCSNHSVHWKNFDIDLCFSRVDQVDGKLTLKRGAISDSTSEFAGLKFSLGDLKDVDSDEPCPLLPRFEWFYFEPDGEGLFTELQSVGFDPDDVLLRKNGCAVIKIQTPFHFLQFLLVNGRSNQHLLVNTRSNQLTIGLIKLKFRPDLSLEQLIYNTNRFNQSRLLRVLVDRYLKISGDGYEKGGLLNAGFCKSA